MVIAGMALASGWVAVLAVLGSALGMGVGVGLGLPPAPVQLGLYGYNSVLAIICVGGVFLRPSPGGTGLSVIAGVMASLLTAAVNGLLAPVGLPALTFPAAVTCVTFTLFASRAWPAHLVPLSSLGVPEAAAGTKAARDAMANDGLPLVRRPRRLSKGVIRKSHIWQPPLAMDSVQTVDNGNTEERASEPPNEVFLDDEASAPRQVWRPPALRRKDRAGADSPRRIIDVLPADAAGGDGGGPASGATTPRSHAGEAILEWDTSDTQEDWRPRALSREDRNETDVQLRIIDV